MTPAAVVTALRKRTANIVAKSEWQGWLLARLSGPLYYRYSLIVHRIYSVGFSMPKWVFSALKLGNNSPYASVVYIWTLCLLSSGRSRVAWFWVSRFQGDSVVYDLRLWGYSAARLQDIPLGFCCKDSHPHRRMMEFSESHYSLRRRIVSAVRLHACSAPLRNYFHGSSCGSKN